MNNNKFYHSVYLDPDLCKGCINCIKRCPTEAIRVRNGKASIISEFCIDCGECVRTCQHHAKKIHRDTLDILSKYEYTVALPPPSMCAQFNNLYDTNILLTAFIYLGFDDVYEVGAAAELVSEASREYSGKHRENWPFISTACPTVVRLIRVRFPNLIDHLLPLNPPIEVAATIARKRAMKKTGLPAEKIGIIFISPCPSKATYIREPLGKTHSEVDGILAVKDIYPSLLPCLIKANEKPLQLARAGRIGIGWGNSGGEASGMSTESYLAADGIENVIKVLEDLEDDKIHELEFIELDACNGGCVGGVLNVENPYVARAKLMNINNNLPISVSTTADQEEDGELYWNSEVEYEPVFRIGENMIDSIKKMRQIDELLKELPGLDCGSCGAPTCRAFAEDVVRGKAEKTGCITVLRNNIHRLTEKYDLQSREEILDAEDPNTCVHLLMDYADKLTAEIRMLDEANLGPRKPIDHSEQEET